MNGQLIPTPDTIPVAWGWFQFLLLLTFPIHLLFMNAMMGSAGIAAFQHFKGGEANRKLAHFLAVFLPLLIAFTVNFGVAPLLFAQVLYGQFIYTSSILMGVFWILIIPILILAYFGAYLYDFRFEKLGKTGGWIISIVFVLFIIIAYFFTNNMLMMTLPDTFSAYFRHMNGTLLVSGHATFLPRYFHMIVGAIAVGGLYTALIGRLKAKSDPKLAAYAEAVGMKVFNSFTLISIVFGIWFLISQPKPVMMLFMSKNVLATAIFIPALILVPLMLVFSFRKKVIATTVVLTVLVFLMTFMRAFVRAGYLAKYFNLGRLKMVPEYSPMILFFVSLAGGLVVLVWMIRKAWQALQA
ncbi:MAG: hypothetical protein GXO69_05465 [Acidobacteria bacterium]|nr:hypothetical protein [Acidobacteriota bacterium]